MAWTLSKSETGRARRTQLLTLAGWGFVATTSFLVAFMALQFSEFDAPTVTAGSQNDAGPVITGSIQSAAGSHTAGSVGLMQKGADAGKPTRTQELSTDVEILRRELIDLRRTVSVIRDSRDQLASRLGQIEQTYQGFTTSITKSKQSRPAGGLPPDPMPVSSSDPRGIPPIPPIPIASPLGKNKPMRSMAETKQPAPIGEKPVAVAANPRVVAAPLHTASISKETEPAAAMQPEGSKTEQTKFGVDLGGYSSLGTLSKGWTELKDRQKTLLADLAPRASLSDKNGRLEVRLVAGPFTNAAHAITLCAQLQAKGRPCQPTLFIGQPVVAQ